MLRHAVCARAVRFPPMAHRRNFSLFEWAQKHDYPVGAAVPDIAPPRLNLPWDEPVKIDLPMIEQRWKELPEAHKGAIIKFLWEKQRGDWNKMTMDEKKASWWVEFGEHGPRQPKPPGFGWRVFGGTTFCVLLGICTFATLRQFAEPYHPGLTREWQEATNEQLRRHYSDPITGVSSEGYKGKGAVFVTRSEKD